MHLKIDPEIDHGQELSGRPPFHSEECRRAECHCFEKKSAMDIVHGLRNGLLLSSPFWATALVWWLS